MRIRLLFVLLLVLVGLAFLSSRPPTHAQPNDDCSTLVTDALQVVGSACSQMGRNEACYGHNLVSATFDPEAVARFESSGDVVELIDLEALYTQPANLQTGTWGVALLNIQADLPEDDRSSMTLVLLGDAEVSDLSFTPSGCTVRNDGSNSINVRSRPNTSGSIEGVFAQDSEGIAFGRNDASDWLRFEQLGTIGWIYAPLVSLDCEIASLDTFADTDISPPPPHVQTISFTSGEPDQCESVPNGLLAHAPEGRRTRVVVNGVELTFSSIGFLTAIPDDQITIQGLTGVIDTTADGQTLSIMPDTVSSVPLRENQADGPPSSLEQVKANDPVQATLRNTSDTLFYTNHVEMSTCDLDYGGRWPWPVRPNFTVGLGWGNSNPTAFELIRNNVVGSLSFDGNDQGLADNTTTGEIPNPNCNLLYHQTWDFRNIESGTYQLSASNQTPIEIPDISCGNNLFTMPAGSSQDFVCTLVVP